MSAVRCNECDFACIPSTDAVRTRQGLSVCMLDMLLSSKQERGCQMLGGGAGLAGLGSLNGCACLFASCMCDYVLGLLCQKVKMF